MRENRGKTQLNHKIHNKFGKIQQDIEAFEGVSRRMFESK